MASIPRCLHARALIVISVLVLQGCAADLFVGNQPIPIETVSELAVRGASLGSTNRRHNPLPEDIGASFYSDNQQMVLSGQLELLILPNEFVKDNRERGYFLYAFSKHLGDNVYELLLNQRFVIIPSSAFVELYVQSELLPGMESLSEIADFYLADSSFILPANATHMELHFLSDDNPDAEPDFVERWELSGFYGYDRYLLPIIESTDQ